MCLHVVVADDSRDTARSFALLLDKMFDCKVTTCFDGAECLEAIKQLSPQIAFIDLEMPGLNGLDVVRGLQDVNPQPYLVAFTGYGGKSLFRLARSVGFNDVELKPIHATRIADLLAVAAQVAQTTTV